MPTLGRPEWHVFADNYRIRSVTVVTPWVTALIGVGVLVLANLLATGPAVASTRQPPGQLLRSQ